MTKHSIQPRDCKEFSVPKRSTHLFVGRVQCLDGFFYPVTEEGKCSHCGGKDERQ